MWLVIIYVGTKTMQNLDFSLMAINRFTSKESETINNRPIVPVSFKHIGLSSCKMGGDEAETCIVQIQSNGYCAFIARHSTKTSLSVFKMFSKD